MAFDQGVRWDSNPHKVVSQTTALPICHAHTDRSGDRTQHFGLERPVNYPLIRCDHIGLGGLLPSEDSNLISFVSKGIPHGTNRVTYHTMPSTDREIRTPDFFLVREALSQLSYVGILLKYVELVGLEPTTFCLQSSCSRQLELQPHARETRRQKPSLLLSD